MDRLTKAELVNGFPVCYPNNCSGLPEFVKKGNPYRNIVERLKAYEDLEEQGKLLKLPCKPHDKLYWISDQDEDAEFSYEPIEEVEVCNIDYNGYSLQLWFADKGAKEFPVLEVSSIGKELFYTREEAEATLKELRDKKG